MADLPSSRSADAPASQSTRQLLDELDDLMQKMLALPVQDNDAEDEGEGEDAAAPQSPAPPPVTSPTPPPRSVNLVPVQPAIISMQGRGQAAPVKQVGAAPVLRPAPVSKDPPLSRVEIRQDKAVPGRTANPPNRQKEIPEPLAAPTYVPAGAEPLLPMMLQRPKPAPEKPAEPQRRPFVPAETRSKPETAPPPLRPSWLKSPPTAQPEPGGNLFLLVAVNRLFDHGTALFGGAGAWLRGEQGRFLLGWSGIAMLAAALIWAAVRFFG